jgi:tetratricopeptide (TPR) repeat protein
MGGEYLRVFVSSKMQELAAEREAVKAALKELLVETFVFEKDAGARSQTIQRTYLEAIEAAELYLGIFWKGYGAYTIEEFDHAQLLGMDCLIYEKREAIDGGRDAELQAFLDRIGQVEQGLVTVKWFNTPAELGTYVKEDVAKYQGRIVRERRQVVSLAVYAGVPAMPKHFLGREEMVLEMVRRLRSGTEKDVAVEGLPGVGKTTLAVSLVGHPGVLRYFGDGVLWAGLGPNADAMSILAGWGGRLTEAGILKGDIASLLTVDERAQAIRDAISQRRMLLVLDDAWESDTAESLRCGGPNCCHLLTTRNKGVARAFIGGPQQARNLSILDETTAFALLQKLAPEACASDPVAAEGLVGAVGGLPLALELLGGFLAAPEQSMFPKLRLGALEKLRDPKERLRLAQKRLGARREEKVSLQKTIALSLEGLPEEAIRAFHALGAFAPKPDRLSLEAAEAVTEAGSEVLALLAARNLVEVEGKADRVAVHQVLADVARLKTDEGASDRHCRYYLALVNENQEDWRRIETAYGQIRWAWRHLPKDASVLEWVRALRTYHHRRGLWREELAWAKRGLELAQAEGLRRDEAVLLTNIGLVYYSLGQGEKALDYYNRALPIDEEVGDRAMLAITLTNIGSVYGSLGQREKALDYYNRTLPIVEEVGDRAGLAATLNNIGSVYDSLGQPEKALDYYDRALPIFEEVGDRAGLAATLNNIGSVFYSLGQPEKALDYYNRALPIREESGDRAGLAAALSNIGSVYYSLGQREKALDYYDRTLSIVEEVGDRAGLATTLSNIGLVYDSLGQREKALDYYDRALPIFEEVGDRAGLAATLTNIGSVYDSLGQREKALDYYDRALPIFEEVGDRAGLAAALSNIGLVYDSLGQPEKALDYYNRALPIREEVGDRAGLAATLNNIGSVYNRLGQCEKALDYYDRALPILEEVGDRAGLAATLSNMGVVFKSLGQREKALDYYNRALPIREEVGDLYGESITRFNIAVIYRAAGLLEEAVTELRRVVELDRLVQNPDLERDISILAEVEAELDTRRSKS